MKKIDPYTFIIFLHIQKTGGITLQRMLRRRLGKPISKRAANLLLPKPAFSTVEQELQAKKIEDRYVVGHFCYGIHRFLPQPYTYMSFLREPVARICSLYYYSKGNPCAYYHQQAQNQSLEDFSLHAKLMELDNGQVRFLAGDRQDFFINRTPIGECSHTLLETAKQNIDTHFSFIGITEQFNQSVLLLQKLMGWDNCLYLRRNTNAASQNAKNTIPSELKQQIAEKNWLDVQLYAYAKEKLAQQLKLHGLEESSLALQNFQQQNARFNQQFGPAYSTYSQAKALVKGHLGRPS